MKYSALLSASALANLAGSSAVVRREPVDHHLPLDLNSDFSRRATPQAPDGYAPKEVKCPSTRPSIRPADRLSDAETQWLEKRRPKTVDPMKDFMKRAKFDGFDAAAYIDKHKDNQTSLPNIALSFSGGGYRALLNGAGALAAFDSRTRDATNEGHLGGLLQSATYVSALSGGGWLVGSIYANNFTSVQSIQDHGDDTDIWQFQNSLLKGPKLHKLSLLSTADYYHNLVGTVEDKVDSTAGPFNSSITDYYGRGLSFQLINASDGAPAYTFSSIQDDRQFSEGEAPMPILIADERSPGDLIISLNATVFEFNPFEMGSFDPTTYGFAPLRYLGSNFSQGELDQDQGCVSGFDNLGFIMGTSSSLFNQIFLSLGNFELPDILETVIKSVLVRLGKDSNDIADYTPNPFYGFNPDTNPSSDHKRLTLVDGGEDLQNIPLNPVIQPMRGVDVIFAIDSSADTIEPSAPNWPNGTALIATFERAETDIMNKTSFPFIPGHETFVAQGLNNRPTFFGCNSSNVTSGDNIPPLVVYIPNAPYSFQSNTSTFAKLDYSLEERNDMIENGYNVVTQGNGTREGSENWPTCVACAVLSRSMERNGEQMPDQCQECFKQYCWDGSLSESSDPYSPDYIDSAAAQKAREKKSSGAMLGVSGVAMAIGAAVAVMAVL